MLCPLKSAFGVGLMLGLYSSFGIRSVCAAAIAYPYPLPNPSPSPAAIATGAVTSPTGGPSLTAPYGILVTSPHPGDDDCPTPQDGDPDFDDYIVVAYHTGAGLNSAVVSKDPPKAVRAWFNSTRGTPQFEIGTGAYYTKPFGFYNRYYDSYSGWGPVDINVGDGQDGFQYDHTGAGLVSGSSTFAGWLVCEWALQAPQLFWIVAGTKAAGSDGEFADECARVQLHYKCLDPVTGARTVPDTGAACYTAPVPRAE